MYYEQMKDKRVDMLHKRLKRKMFSFYFGN